MSTTERRWYSGVSIVLNDSGRRPTMIHKMLCMLGAHDWDYPGYAYSFAPKVIHCYYCDKKYK